MAQQVTADKIFEVVVTDSGELLHSLGTDFIFSFLAEGLDDKVKETVTKAFLDATAMLSAIKKAVKHSTGRDVVDGLYTLDHASMIKVLNSIEGMGQTTIVDRNEKGSGTAAEINQKFFGDVLAGVDLSGDLGPLKAYLVEAMGKLQTEIKKSKISGDFGMVIVIISLMPILNIPVTTFKYVYSSKETSKWLVGVNCRSTTHYSYDYKYTAVNYNYVKAVAQVDK